MTKYYCDFCNKSAPQKELKVLVIADNLCSDACKEYYDICKDCVDKIHEMIEGKKLGEEKS